MNAIENEFHILINCSFYNAEKSEFFYKINKFNVNYTYLNIIDKARWLLLQEDQEIIVLKREIKVLNE